MGDDKDTIITAMLARGQAYVNEYTSSATGTIVDNAVEDFAALYILQRMVAGSSSANTITVGEITIGKKEISVQIKELRKQAVDKLKIIGRGGTRFRLTDPVYG